jgi:ParB-like chromosome segregation protein Spo0J
MTQPQPASTLIEYVPIGDLTPHPRNARQGDIGAIITSIEKNGWFGTIVVQKSTKYILAGNHRYMAAKQMGMTHLPVYWVDCDDDRALAILVADNRLSDLGTYDNDALLDILSDIQGADMLLETGYDEQDIARMLSDGPTPKEEKPAKQITCPSCGEKFSAGG